MRRIARLSVPRIFGVLVALPGLGVAGWAGFTAFRWALAYAWPAVPCVIVASGVRAGNERHPYRFVVTYQYSWQGRRFTASTYQEDYRGGFDIAAAERHVRSYPAGSRSVCYVNPHRPATAVLRHDNPLLPASLAVSMAFASLALGRFLTGRGRLDRDGGPFLILLGVTGYVLLFGLPLWTGLRSLGWIPVGCVVQGAMVQSERDTGMFAYTVYWPDVVYQYRVAGETYRANTHNAAFVGSPWYYGARRVVREHSPGRITTCYVNPGDPSEAVLVRGPSDTQWVGLWAMFLVALGIDSIVTAHTGRHLLHGRSPRVLGAVALWTVAGLAFTVLLAIADDLRADVRAGAAELPEYALVALVGALAVGLVPCCVATLLPNRGQRQAGRRVKTAPVAPVVWDREIDG